MGALTAASNFKTYSNNSITKNVVSPKNLYSWLATDIVTWSVYRNYGGGLANIMGETVTVTNSSGCSVSPSSQTYSNSTNSFTVSNFTGSSYSVQLQVTDTENSINYYAKLQGSVSDAYYNVVEASSGQTALIENTAYAFDWTSNFTLNSSTLAYNRTRFQEAAASLSTTSSTGTINLTTNSVSSNLSASVTLRYGGTTGAILGSWAGTVYNTPATPSLSFSNITETSIRVTAVGSGGTLQVSNNGSTWSSNPTTYTGLSHTTSYTFYARVVNGPAVSGTGSASQATLDATPSTALQLGSWKGAALRNVYYYASTTSSSPSTSEASAGTFTVAGISTGANVLLSRALISGTATSGQHKVNSGNWTDAPTQLGNGDSVKFRILSPSSYASSVRYDWTVENLNTDNFQVSTAAAPNAPGAPTNISFSPASTANNNITVTATASGGSGTIDYTYIRKGTSGSFVANGSSFAAIRGSASTYQAFNSNDGGNSSVYSENYTPPYLATDTTINAVGNVAVAFAASSFAVSISPAESNQGYQLRTGGFTGTLRASSSVGSGYISCSSGLPAATNPVGSPVTYYVTTYRTTGSGGSGSYASTGRSFTVSRTSPTTTPNQFELGNDASGVEVSSGNYESNTITVTGIQTAVSISITGGQYKIGTGNYTSNTGTVSANQSVTVRVSAASTPSTTTTATLTIGGVQDTFSVITEGNPGTGSSEGDGGQGTYGLRCFDSSNNISLDISDRVVNEVEYLSTSMTSTQTQKNITLSRAASGFLHLNPTGTVIDTTQSPPVVKDWLILDFELTSTTNLRIKRQSHNNTALSTIKVLIFND